MPLFYLLPRPAHVSTQQQLPKKKKLTVQDVAYRICNSVDVRTSYALNSHFAHASIVLVDQLKGSISEKENN